MKEDIKTKAVRTLGLQSYRDARFIFATTSSISSSI